MSKLESGRVNQKKKTRDTLIRAAADMLMSNRIISIAEVADIASVSRATAYRYFPTPESITTRAVLWRLADQAQTELNKEHSPEESTFDRIDSLVVVSDKITNKYRGELRAMLRIALERQGSDAARPMLRNEALRKALKNHRAKLGASDFERLIAALSLTLGIESQVVLEDVCQLSRSKALSVKRWVAQTILMSALEHKK